jgi:hypothetical protein
MTEKARALSRPLLARYVDQPEGERGGLRHRAGFETGVVRV